MSGPIWVNTGDSNREQIVMDKLCELYGWQAWPTPKYYFMDYLVNSLQDPTKPDGFANFIGGMEIKWMNGPSTMEVKFPFQKLQRMWLSEPVDDNPSAYNRICIRYTDALLVVPAKALRSFIPQYGLTRADTNEHDFNVHFTASEDFPSKLMKVVVNDR